MDGKQAFRESQRLEESRCHGSTMSAHVKPPPWLPVKLTCSNSDNENVLAKFVWLTLLYVC